MARTTAIKNRRRNKSKQAIGVLFLILLISAWFRFYKLEELFFFSLDEEVIALHIRRITTLSHFPAIGVNAADTGLYVGPLYFYISAPLFYLLHNQPIAGAIIASLTGVFATLAIFWLGKTLGNTKIGLIAASIHAISIPIVLFERRFINPNPAIAVGSLILICLHKLNQRQPRYLYLLAILLGFTLHLNLMLLVYVALAIIWVVKTKPVFSSKAWMISLSLFIFMICPLIFFDVRHGLQLSKATIQSFTSRRAIQSAQQTSTAKAIFPIYALAKFPAEKVSSNNIISEYTTCPTVAKNPPHTIGIILCFAGIAYTLAHYRRHQLATTSLAIGIAALIAYPGRVQDYYAVILFPAFAVLLAHLMYSIRVGKHYLAPIMFLVTLFGINGAQLITMTNPHGLTRKLELTKTIIAQTTAGQYELVRRGDECFGWGLNYPLLLSQHPPARSFTDPIISWLYLPSDTPTQLEAPQTVSINANISRLSVSVQP